MKAPSLLRGVFSFSAMTMISRVLGLVRDIAISHVFGANAATLAGIATFAGNSQYDTAFGGSKN